MKIFEGKTPTEKKKIIAAIVLGVMALLALGYTFGGSFFGRKTDVKVSVSPTPKGAASPSKPGNPTVSSLPSEQEVNFAYATTVVPNPVVPFAPEAGRNIFAFREPPPKTPYSPTPIPEPPTPKPATPTPTPPQTITYFQPREVFTGARAFLLEINGDKFTPDTRIIFNGGEIPTTFVSSQRLTANIPGNFISSGGIRTIMVRTPDGKLYSNQIMLNVLEPPTPQLQYIGAKLAARANNNTAYFQESGKDKPFSARLNDRVGRFRLISISSEEVVFEDAVLDFKPKHRLPLVRPAAGTTSSRFEPTNPTIVVPNQPFPVNNTDCIPGIPCNIPRYNPNNTNTVPLPQQRPPQKKDEDDDDGDN